MKRYEGVDDSLPGFVFYLVLGSPLYIAKASEFTNKYFFVLRDKFLNQEKLNFFKQDNLSKVHPT